MNEFDDTLQTPQPKKAVPILIGALAITALSAIPVISFVNCLCCAGVMGGAVLGVWFYKKNFPPDMPFTVGNGAMIGTFSGMVASVIMSCISALQLGLFSGEFSTRFQQQLEETMLRGSGDPQAMEQIQKFMDTLSGLAETPVLLFLLLLIFSLLLYTGFGALGGVIGGNIFKTRIVQPPVTPPDTIR
jgi:hypothetical protein